MKSIAPMVLLACLLAGIVLPVPAEAQAQRTHIMTRGAWSVFGSYAYSNDSLACVATTRNSRGQLLELIMHEDGTAMFFISDNRWRLRPGMIDFRINVDQRNWQVDGAGRDSTIAFRIDDKRNSARFYEELKGGNVLTFRNFLGERVAYFSLSGSRKALDTMLRCWSLI